jgi:hypothetical protein
MIILVIQRAMAPVLGLQTNGQGIATTSLRATVGNRWKQHHQPVAREPRFSLYFYTPNLAQDSKMQFSV